MELLSDGNLSQKHLYFSPQKPIKKIANSNSSSLLRVGKINIDTDDLHDEINRVRNKKVFGSFVTSSEETKSYINPFNGLDNDIYERLRNENVDFIKTLLRFKAKMYYQNLGYSNHEKRRNKQYELIDNLKMKKNIKTTPRGIKDIQNRNVKKEKPIKIKPQINYSENKTKKKNNFFHNKIDSSLKTSKTSIHSTLSEDKTNIKVTSPNKIIKQRAISEIPNNSQIKKIQQLIKPKNFKFKTQQKNSSNILLNINITSKINNNNPNKNIIKKLKEKKKKNIPIAEIDLFGDDVSDDIKIRGKSSENEHKYHFSHKRIKTNY
jgi:hypothetical protein